jgi:hypothetical protein
MSLQTAESSSPGIGRTRELRLRVSVATLARVLFEHPRNGDLMLALERKATMHNAGTGRVVEVKSQPFGGALRIHDLGTLQNVIGDFHFDSVKSRSEQDFRVFIRPSAWERVRDFCLQCFSEPDDHVLESNPERELAEEFAETLNISLKPDQYTCKPVGSIIENEPSPTENANARGYPTVRMYRIFEAHVMDSSLAADMLTNSQRYSDRALHELALQDYRNGGPGRANAVLTLPLSQVIALYLATSPEARNGSISFQDHQLDETVSAILEGVRAPKYRRA